MGVAFRDETLRTLREAKKQQATVVAKRQAAENARAASMDRMEQVQGEATRGLEANDMQIAQNSIDVPGGYKIAGASSGASGGATASGNAVLDIMEKVKKKHERMGLVSDEELFARKDEVLDAQDRIMHDVETVEGAGGTGECALKILAHEDDLAKFMLEGMDEDFESHAEKAAQEAALKTRKSEMWKSVGKWALDLCASAANGIALKRANKHDPMNQVAGRAHDKTDMLTDANDLNSECSGVQGIFDAHADL